MDGRGFCYAPRMITAPAHGPTTAHPMTIHEHSLHDAGLHAVAGVDEVGRGALAGPLVSAAVILPPLLEVESDPFWERVRDSKTILEPERVRLASGILERVRASHIAFIDPETIDRIGVGPANRIAMETAISGLPIAPDLALLDAFITDLGLPQVSLIKGDSRSLSIAAASIVAKVARDTVMHDLDADYAVFGFGRHKGYGVASHLAALNAYGPCPAHRRCFAPVSLAQAAFVARVGTYDDD
ncbi:MAG: ribonuclease HII [Thermomicrobiales bacterium]